MARDGSYTGVVFGLFALLGYRFSPGSPTSVVRFWRMNPATGYGVLDRITLHQSNPGSVTQRWNDLL